MSVDKMREAMELHSETRPAGYSQADFIGGWKAALAEQPAQDDGIYSQGICGDGAAILRHGLPMTVDEIVAALNAKPAEQPAQGVPEGWRLVPVEPDRDQLVAMDDAFTGPQSGIWLRVYHAMLAAAPEPLK